MDVKPKRNGSVSKLPNAIHRFKSTRHANFNHSITERSNVGDDINIPRANISGTKINFFDFSIESLKLGSDLIRLVRSPLLHKRLEHMLVVLTLLVEFRSTLGKLLLSLTLFTQPRPLLPLRLFLGLFSILIPERQIELLKTKHMVPSINPQVDERAKTFHLFASTLQPFTSRLTITSFNGEDAILNLRIVGAQHHF